MASIGGTRSTDGGFGKHGQRSGRRLIWCALRQPKTARLAAVAAAVEAVEGTMGHAGGRDIRTADTRERVAEADGDGAAEKNGTAAMCRTDAMPAAPTKVVVTSGRDGGPDPTRAIMAIGTAVDAVAGVVVAGAVATAMSAGTQRDAAEAAKRDGEIVRSTLWLGAAETATKRATMKTIMVPMARKAANEIPGKGDRFGLRLAKVGRKGRIVFFFFFFFFFFFCGLFDCEEDSGWGVERRPDFETRLIALLTKLARRRIDAQSTDRLSANKQGGL